jgi:hypothetical protein
MRFKFMDRKSQSAALTPLRHVLLRAGRFQLFERLTVQADA